MTEKQNRGFRAMPAETQRRIASLGGRAAHSVGAAHEWTTEEAKVAGRKGGKAAHAGGKAHEWDHAEATEAGRKGGLAVAANRVLADKL